MPQNEVNPAKLLWVGPLTVLLSLAAVFAVRVVAFATLDLNPEYPPLTLFAITLFTTVLVAMAVLVFAVVIWKARTPVRTYRLIAVVALMLSCLPDLFLPGQDFPGATWAAAIVLMVMHVAAWLPVQFVLTNPRLVGSRPGERTVARI